MDGIIITKEIDKHMVLNTDFFSNYSLVAASTIPIILAVVQSLKMIGLQNKYAPLVSIFIGIVISMLLNNFVNNISSSILTGILLGLSSSGLYSGLKETQHAVIEAQKEKKVKARKENEHDEI